MRVPTHYLWGTNTLIKGLWTESSQTKTTTKKQNTQFKVTKAELKKILLYYSPLENILMIMDN